MTPWKWIVLGFGIVLLIATVLLWLVDDSVVPTYPDKGTTHYGPVGGQP